MIACSLREPVNGFRDLGRTGEKPLHGPDMGGVAGARHDEIALVGIEDAGIPFRHEQALAVGVGDQLGQVVAACLPRELQETDSEEKQCDQTDDGQKGEEAQSESSRLVLRQERIRGCRGHEQQSDDEHQ